jgi:hypothetical protein
VLPTIIALLAAWLGLNVAFVAIRFYVTAGKRPRAASQVDARCSSTSSFGLVELIPRSRASARLSKIEKRKVIWRG